MLDGSISIGDMYRIALGDMERGMARSDPQINVRLPVDLKDWLEERAKRNVRSLNGEMAFILMEKRAAEAETAGEPVKTTPTV